MPDEAGPVRGRFRLDETTGELVRVELAALDPLEERARQIELERREQLAARPSVVRF